MNKRAILVASFGTSHNHTCAKTIAAIETAFSGAFPGWEVRRAFTSGMIRRKLKARDGVEVDSVAEALERLAHEGYHTVLCQPTHVITGKEYEDILSTTAAYSSRFPVLKTGAPLLAAKGDYQRLADVLGHQLPPRRETVYCLMGHGSENHPADASYAILARQFKAMGREDILVGTVEGVPGFDAMLEQVRESEPKRCVLAPLMVVAGDHAVNDMASDEPDSWKSRLVKEGFQVECVLKGLGEYPQVREIYVKRVVEMAGKSAR